MEHANDSKIRLNRFLSSCGLGARRSCEKIILAGRVAVNGNTTHDLATRVDPEQDVVFVDDKQVEPIQEEVTLLFNKPRGYVVSREDEGEHKNIFQILKGFPRNLNYAGRLDAFSEGLLLLSTNGELINRLTHPRYKVTKVYLVTTERRLTPAELTQFRTGIELEEGVTLEAHIDALDPVKPEYRIILSEGRNRQIRRMLESLGTHAKTIRRVAYGPLLLGNLKPGDYRSITSNEWFKLKRNLKLKG